MADSITSIVELASLLSTGSITESFESPDEVVDGVQTGEIAEHAMTLLDQSDFGFDDSVVKTHLDEILLLLIGVRNGANGKQLIEDVSQVFGTVLSPGTVYPTLYELEDDGVLDVQKHIRTKEYRLTESAMDGEKVTDSIRQEVVLSFLLVLFETEILSGDESSTGVSDSVGVSGW